MCRARDDGTAISRHRTAGLVAGTECLVVEVLLDCVVESEFLILDR
jgi:hypothetical protein